MTGHEEAAVAKRDGKRGMQDAICAVGEMPGASRAVREESPCDSLDLVTFLGYVGLTCFETSFYICLFDPFFSDSDAFGNVEYALMILAVVFGMALAFGVFMSPAGSSRFPVLFRKTPVIFAMAVLLIPSFVGRIAVAWGISFSLVVLCGFAVMSGVASAFFYLAWQLTSWNLSVKSFVRFLGVCGACSCLLLIMVEVTLAEEYRNALGAFLSVMSGFVLYSVSGGKRADWAIEHDDMTGSFVVEKRVDVIYALFQFVDGVSVVLLLVFYRHFFLLAPLFAAMFLAVFLFFVRKMHTYAGKFLLGEMRGYVSFTCFALVMLAVPVDGVRGVALCCIVASWMALWVFQGIFLERVLGYGPASAYYVSFADFNQNVSFFFGVAICVLGLVFVGDPSVLLLSALVLGAGLILAGALFLPIEGSLDVRRSSGGFGDDCLVDGGSDGACTGGTSTPFQVAAEGSRADIGESSGGETGASSPMAVLINRRSDEFVDLFKLSKREGEVLRLLARGSTAKFIGNQLGMSEHTARVHIYHIYEKMGIHSRQALIDLFDEMG